MKVIILWVCYYGLPCLINSLTTREPTNPFPPNTTTFFTVGDLDGTELGLLKKLKGELQGSLLN